MDVSLKRWRKKFASSKASRQQHRRPRRAQLETLEKRQLLTATVWIDSVQNAAEPNQDGYFRLMRSDTSGSLTVEYGIDPNYTTATGGADYASLSGSVGFPSGSASVDIPVNVYDDAEYEGNESLKIFLKESSCCSTSCCGGCCGGPAYYLGTPSDATLTIADDEQAPQVWIDSVYNAAEPNQDGYFRLQRDNTSGSLTVTYEIDTTATTATGGADFAYLPGTGSGDNAGEVTFTAGSAYVDIPVNVYDDTAIEGDEYLKVLLTSCSGCCGGGGYSLGTPSDATLTIADDDQPPTVWVESVQDAAEPAQDGYFRLKRDDTTGSLTVKYVFEAAASSADAGLDFAYLPGTGSGDNEGEVTFADGSAYVDIPVNVYDDTEVEGDEDVHISLQSSSSCSSCCCGGTSDYTLGTPSSAALTIADDDGYTLGTIFEKTVEEDPLKCECETHFPGHLPVFYNGPDDGLVVLEVELSAPRPASDTIEVAWQLDNGTTEYSYFSTDNLDPNSPEVVRLAHQFDVSSLGSGQYSYSATFSSSQLQPSPSNSFSGKAKVINPLGRAGGWDVGGIARLEVQAAGVLVNGGRGDGDFYTDNGDGTYAAPAGAFASLVKNGDGTYTLTDHSNSTLRFDGGGLLTSRVKPNGQTTTYDYTDANGDAVIDDLSAVHEPDGHSTTFSYSGGRLDSVTDHAGRVSTVAYDVEGRLASVTQPDPDGTGSLEPMTTSYGYDASKRLTSVTQPSGAVTQFVRDSFGFLAERVAADGAKRVYSPYKAQGLPADGSGTSTNPALLVRSSDALGSQTNEQQRVTQYALDRHGNPSRVVDALGNRTTYERDADGLLTRLVLPDPDGAGSLTAAEYTYTYDSRGNRTSETLPDASVRSWEYHATWNAPVRYTDADGRITLYDYDSADRLLLSKTHVVGQIDDSTNGETDDLTTTYTYTPEPSLADDPPQGLLASATDPLGRTTSYEYDHHGHLTKTTYAVGTVEESFTSATYDSAGNLLTKTGELGNTTSYEYDNLDRLVRVTGPDPDGTGPLTAPVTDFQYDQAGDLVSVTDNGRQTSYQYNSSGQLTGITQPDPDGTGPLAAPTSSYTYTADGKLASEIDPLSRTTSYAYTEGLLTSVTLPDPDGSGALTAPVISYTYDATGRVLSETDPLGNVTSYDYDALGRPTLVSLPDPDDGGPLTAPQTSYVYNNAVRLASVTDPENQTASYTYTADGLVATVTDPRGTTSYQYDALARPTLVSEPDPDGTGPEPAPFTEYAYDAASQLVRTTTLDGDALREYNQRGWLLKATQPDPDGAGSGLAPWTVFTYDAAGNVLTETDRLGNADTYRYDNLHRLVEHEDAKAGLTQYAYDQFGNRASLTDPLGNTTSWTYDNLDRVTGETNSLSATRQFAYDAASNLTSRTDRNGRVIEYGVDNLDRQIEERWLASDGSALRTLSWSYDAASNLLSASDPAAAYSYQYDNLGRNTSVTHNLAGLTDDVVMAQEHDALGRRTALAATIGGTADFRNAYQHDYLNRMTQITQASQSGGNAVAEKRIDLAYDADDKGQWTSITRYADLAGTQLVAATGYSYDQTDRLTGLTHSQGATTLADYGWTYDAANRVTQFTSLADGTSDYTYDATDQVTGATHSYQADEGYTYDSNGNRTNTGYTTGSDNRLLSDGTYDYTYDAEGNRTKKTEIATGEATEYTWDHRNRLVKVVHLDSSGNPTQTLDYAYDVFDRRIGKSDTPAVGPAYLEDYVYDGQHLALEFEAGQLANRYLHGPVIDQILADEQVDSLTSPGEVIWPLTDNLGTVRDLAKHDAATGATTVANHVTYDAFGRVTGETDAAVDHLFGYTGREWDADADLQYNRARWYDPAVGRWLSQDPIGFSAGDANLYRYVGNGSTNATDPSGLYLLVSPDQRETMRRFFGEDNVRFVSEGDGYRVVLTEGARRHLMLEYEGGNREYKIALYNSASSAGRMETLEALNLRYTRQSHGVGSQDANAIPKEGGYRRLPGTVPGSVKVDDQGQPDFEQPAWAGDVLAEGYGHGYLMLLEFAAGEAAGGAICLGGRAVAGRLLARYGDNAAHNAADYLRLKDKLGGEEIFEEALRGRGSPMIGSGTSRTLRDAQRLADTYGGNPADWAKMGGGSRTLSDGRKIEIHWYENLKTGTRCEYKTKIQ